MPDLETNKRVVVDYYKITATCSTSQSMTAATDWSLRHGNPMSCAR